MTDDPQPRIPGVRYRTEERTRLVTTTINGESRQTPETYYVQVPVPPRDWDRIILRAVTTAAILVTVLSVVWTTTSIGGLLSKVVPAYVALGVAAVFDVTWLSCQAVEWLERYDPKRARVARVAGWIALGIAMGAVVAEGATTGAKVSGGVGASVSLLAKGLWVIVLKHFSVLLSPGVSNWLLQKRQEITATLALSGELRRLDADDAYTKLVYGQTAAAVTGITQADTTPALSAPVPGPPAQADAPTPGHVPPPPPAAPAPAPATPQAGETHAVPGHGPTARGAGEQVLPAPPPAVPAPQPAADTSGQAAKQTPAPAGAPPVAPIGQSIAATIRAKLTDTPHIRDEDLIEHVRSVHGDRLNLADTVVRTRRRHEQKNRNAS